MKTGIESIAGAPESMPVPDFWAAVNDDGDIEMSMSTDDANGGEAARQEIHDWINEKLRETGEMHHCVALYRKPPPQETTTMKRDAERYRWLRDGPNKPSGEPCAYRWEKGDHEHGTPIGGETLDAAIDVAMTGESYET